MTNQRPQEDEARAAFEAALSTAKIAGDALEAMLDKAVKNKDEGLMDVIDKEGTGALEKDINAKEAALEAGKAFLREVVCTFFETKYRK